jgi:pentatricopeptide repeat protein
MLSRTYENNFLLKVILTTLLKVYARRGLFEKAKELLAELETLGYAQDEVHISHIKVGIVI